MVVVVLGIILVGKVGRKEDSVMLVLFFFFSRKLKVFLWI